MRPRAPRSATDAARGGPGPRATPRPAISTSRRCRRHPSPGRSGLSVGGVGFHRAPIEGAVEIGYGLAPVARGRGIATEAVRALLEVARANGAPEVIAETDDGNVASERVLERCGFVRVRPGNGVTLWRHVPGDL